MTVTDKQKEKGHLYRVKFDLREDVLLDVTVCDNALLKKGTKISEEELDLLIEASDYERAKSRALWYLDRGMLTEKGLLDKLLKAKFKKDASLKVVERLKELGLVDDIRFCEIYLQRLIESNASKRQIYFKLCEKGVPKDLAKETAENLPLSEEAQIKNLIERKYKSKLNGKENIRKVYAALARKGFSYTAIKSVLKNYEDEINFYFED